MQMEFVLGGALFVAFDALKMGAEECLRNFLTIILHRKGEVRIFRPFRTLLVEVKI